jgi:hypothetical protein
MKSLTVFALAGVLALATGCGSVATQSSEPGPIAFQSDSAPSEGATVFLRGMPTLGDRIVFEVVARGAKEVHGVAFRVTYDAETLSFAGSEAGSSWSKNVLALAKEGTPGQLAIDANTDTVLGTVTFEVKGRKGTPVSFKVERSQIVDKRGAKLAATWRGGTLAAR